MLYFSVAATLPMLFQPVLAESSNFLKPMELKTEQLVAEQQLNWETNATGFRGQIDQDFTFICPSSGRVGGIWGTDVYTDDSSICSAAVHVGLITARDGGRVTIRIRPGADFYNGTTRNGVSSRRYDNYPGSFIFLDSAGSPIAAATQVLLLDWTNTATNLRGRLDQDFVFDCPSNGSVNSVWGTDVYTDDSSVCSAAVHAGLITTRDGGRVTIRIRPGAEFYNGTTRNGVSSRRYDNYQGSFIFID